MHNAHDHSRSLAMKWQQNLGDQTSRMIAQGVGGARARATAVFLPYDLASVDQLQCRELATHHPLHAADCHAINKHNNFRS